MNKEYVVVLRVRVDDDTLRVFGRRNGVRKCTLRDFRAWCSNTLDEEIQEVVRTPEWQPEEE